MSRANGSRTLAVAMRTLLAALVFAGGATAAGASDPTDPNSCRGLWEAVGLPVPTKDTAEGAGFVTVCHKGYVVLHNNQAKIPDWVIEHLTRDLVSGENTRPDKSFDVETAIPDATRRATDDDYRNSGLARGHQAASADFSADESLMVDTFFFSNVVPQVGAGFNSGIWSTLERLTRNLAVERGEITVVTGPVYQDVGISSIERDGNVCDAAIALPLPEKKFICDANDDDATKPCENGVAVPLALYKILYDPGRQRVNAYLLPNLSHTPLKKRVTDLEYLKRHRVSVRLLEALTGYDFFADFDTRRQGQLEELCPATFLR